MKPLADVRIVAIEQYGAGPFGSLHLADLGAEVIKIEDPSTGGDVGRYVPPFQEGEDSLFFETFNRNKRSLSLDVSSPAGRGVLEDLVRISDVLYSNLRGDVPERLKIRYDDMKDINSKIVCCSLSGFGMTGPRSAEPGYDYILQGLGGWMSLTGEPEGPPAKSGLSLVDYCGGLVAGLSVIAGVHAARRDGIGMDCDVSLYDVAISMLTYPATWHLNRGFEPVRTARSAHPSLVPFQNFPTSDGWIVIGCAKEKFWQRLTDVIGRPELATDERFVNFDSRRRNATELIEILDGILVTDTTENWIKQLSGAGVPCGPINTVEQALAEPHTEARGLIVETEHPRFGMVRQPASPVRVGEPPKEHRRAPHRNEDADYVLSTLLGYDRERISKLEVAGAFGETT
jgi:crotonobetainyl-CoA:carnitine CoA-transferase CaiB-like acyl-CoA transferase